MSEVNFSIERAIYLLEFMTVKYNDSLTGDEMKALKFALSELYIKSHEINMREALQKEV